jgi:hypothetical protein
MKNKAKKAVNYPLVNPFLKWEWLRKPALLIVLVGGLGVLQLTIDRVGALLAILKFPPLWGCLVWISAGVILLVISATATAVRQNRFGEFRRRRGWRSL